MSDKTITAETLQPFCSTHEARPHFWQPWTRDGFTYATDGMLIVRVPAIVGVPEIEKAPDSAKLWNGPVWDADGKPMPELPEAKTKACAWCDGKGKWSQRFDKTLVETTCIECDGVGHVDAVQRVKFGRHTLSDRLLRLIATLPNVLLYDSVGELDPIKFTFDGGDGLLMPMREP